MSKSRIKVFHGLVNYGTQAGLLARGLREEGFDAISVSLPDPYKRLIDIELLYGGNIIQKVFKHTWNWLRRFYWFFRYNTFHFYYGTSLFPYQVDLPLYKLLGKKLVTHYLGGDVMCYKTCADRYDLPSNHKFVLCAKDHDEKTARRLVRERKYTNFQFVCAPNYFEYAPYSSILPLAIDLSRFEYLPLKQRKELIIMHAPTNRIAKGTEYIEGAVNRLIFEKFPVKFDLVEHITHDELILRYMNCDIFIDQISCGWYGTASIEAMAIGRPTICYIDPQYMDYINYGNELPIISAARDNIYEVLKDTITNRNRLWGDWISIKEICRENT